MFQNLKKLYDNELYGNVLPIGSLLISMYNKDRSLLTPDQYFLSLMYFGNSLLEERQHRRAEEIFTVALQAKKSCIKLKSSTIGAATVHDTDPFSAATIRYKLALCLRATKQITEAVSHLQAIPVKQRTPKMNLLLTKLLQVSNYDKNAIQPLKAVLAECPLNLEAIRGLLALLVKPAEIMALLADAGLPSQCIDWLQHYVAAYAHMYAGRFGEAIEALRACESMPGVGDNEAILVLIGQCHHYVGDTEKALAYLTRAYNANNYMTEGLMTLAALYGATGRLFELERLTLPAVAPATYTAEYWFVLAQHLYAQRKYEKAAHFAQKSCFMRPKNAEAMLLRVKIFIQAKNYKEAIVYLRMLQQFADYRFEVHEGLVDAFIATNRLGDAQVIGRDVVRRHKGNLSARYYVLLVLPYLVQYEPQHQARVKGLLQRALEKDEYHMPAAMLLANLMRQEGDRASTAKLLKKMLAKRPNAKLYALLGDLFNEEKDKEKAVEYYTIAINLDPTNRKAVAGLIAMGQTLNPKADQSNAYGSQSSSTDEDSGNFDNAVMAFPGAGGETEPDEALWTDIEIEVNTSS